MQNYIVCLLEEIGNERIHIAYHVSFATNVQ
jgi:hypothetical protein